MDALMHGTTRRGNNNKLTRRHNMAVGVEADVQRQTRRERAQERAEQANPPAPRVLRQAPRRQQAEAKQQAMSQLCEVATSARSEWR